MRPGQETLDAAEAHIRYEQRASNARPAPGDHVDGLSTARPDVAQATHPTDAGLNVSMNDRPAVTRTIWAEMHVESFIAPTFIAEFVFRSPQVVDGTQKEVADFLVLRGEQALLVSQKCQEDPTSRAGEKLQRWARKRAEGAVAQLKGALRRVGDGREIWCEHPRRGRVPFPNGLPPITHAIATVEIGRAS